jgi:hypothetical protein
VSATLMRPLPVLYHRRLPTETASGSSRLVPCRASHYEAEQALPLGAAMVVAPIWALARVYPAVSCQTGGLY